MSTLLMRAIRSQILKDLSRKMVFLGGPRQVGKTTFAQSLLENYTDGHPGYLNWDDPLSKKKILNREWPHDHKLIVIDEFHKYKAWRNTIKGHYDAQKNTHQFLLTGSARLDLYLKGGDSLLGRYHYHRLHPFSVGELGITKKADVEHLLKFGGFPEPFYLGSETELKRWHIQRAQRVVQTDIRDLENIREISMLEQLISALPERVGSPLSRKSLSEDLGVDFKTVERWVTILEQVYYCYRISPFGPPKIRAVKKEQKLYLWDWSEITSMGARFENMVASHLLKYCHHLEDTQGEKMELRFLRDTDCREVDFVVLKNKAPLFAVECKTGEKSLSNSLRYFQERTKIPIFYQVHLGEKDYSPLDRTRILPFVRFCKEVGIP